MDYNGIVLDLLAQIKEKGREFLKVMNNNKINSSVRRRFLIQIYDDITNLINTFKLTHHESIRFVI